MENPTWARMIVVGLILAILAAGYFLLSGGFVKSKPKTTATSVQTSQVVATDTPAASGNVGVGMVYTPTPSPTPKPSTPSAYNTLLQRNQNQAQNQYGTQNNPQTLPRTGFPVGLAVVFSISAAISGWGLRKYPH